jgi:uncharacterized DUF497 family protein
MIEFEWDEEKAKANLARHGISLEEARFAFSDPNHMRHKTLCATQM